MATDAMTASMTPGAEPVVEVTVKKESWFSRAKKAIGAGLASCGRGIKRAGQWTWNRMKDIGRGTVTGAKAVGHGALVVVGAVGAAAAWTISMIVSGLELGVSGVVLLALLLAAVVLAVVGGLGWALTWLLGSLNMWWNGLVYDPFVWLARGHFSKRNPQHFPTWSRARREAREYKRAVEAEEFDKAVEEMGHEMSDDVEVDVVAPVNVPVRVKVVDVEDLDETEEIDPAYDSREPEMDYDEHWADGREPFFFVDGTEVTMTDAEANAYLHRDMQVLENKAVTVVQADGESIRTAYAGGTVGLTQDFNRNDYGPKTPLSKALGKFGSKVNNSIMEFDFTRWIGEMSTRELSWHFGWLMGEARTKQERAYWLGRKLLVDMYDDDINLEEDGRLWAFAFAPYLRKQANFPTPMIRAGWKDMVHEYKQHRSALVG